MDGRQRSLVAALAAFLLATFIGQAGWLDRWEARSWDMRVDWLAAPGPASEQIAVILLDQASLDWASQESGLGWPWPRELYGVLTDFVARSSAHALALDVLYLEPSVYGVGDDQRFAEAMERHGRTVLPLFASRAGEEEGQGWPEGYGDAPLPLSQQPWWPVSQRVHLPIEPLAVASAQLGNARFSPDDDAIYRRLHPFEWFDGRAIPALGLAAWRAAYPEAEVVLEAGRLRLGEYSVPLGADGTALLRFRGPSGTHETVSAAAVLQSELRLRAGEQPVIDPTLFDDRYVFFGFSAPGLFDLRPTPVSGIYPGVEIQATLLDNLLSGDFLRQPPRWVGLAVAAFLAWLSAMLLTRYTSVAGTLAVGGGLLLLPLPLAAAAYQFGYWLPLMLPALAVALAILFATVLNQATEGRQKRFIRNAFQRYLSPQVIEQLVNHPEQLRLGGERRELSIFFSDLAGFTALSEGLEPEPLTELLNDYLSEMSEIILDEGGTIDKYEGDAIIAFWNAPLPVADHAQHAVRAAVRCQQRLAELQPRYIERVGRPLSMRIGLHTGHAVVGNMGSRTRFDYTMLGDAVNLAARLEGVNKVFATQTLLSGSMAGLVRDHCPLREVGRVAVVGRAEPVTLFQPRPEALEADAVDAFHAALELFYQGDFHAAETAFARLADHDPVAACYVDHSRRLSLSTQAAWSGVLVLDSK